MKINLAFKISGDEREHKFNFEVTENTDYLHFAIDDEEYSYWFRNKIWKHKNHVLCAEEVKLDYLNVCYEFN